MASYYGKTFYDDAFSGLYDNAANSPQGYLSVVVETNYSGKLVVTLKSHIANYSNYIYYCTYNGTKQSKSSVGVSEKVSFTYDFVRSVNSIVIQFGWNNGGNWFTLEQYSSDKDITVTWDVPNTAPTATITVPALKAGKTARISWTTSDSDGDTVKARKLVRYYKASGATRYTQTTLYNNSSGTTTKYYDDTIPEDAVGGSIYYVLTIYDGYTTATATSATVVVTAGAVINGQVTIGGVAKDFVTGYANIGGAWKELVSGYANAGGIWKELFDAPVYTYSLSEFGSEQTIKSTSLTYPITIGEGYSLDTSTGVITLSNPYTDTYYSAAFIQMIQTHMYNGGCYFLSDATTLHQITSYTAKSVTTVSATVIARQS